MTCPTAVYPIGGIRDFDGGDTWHRQISQAWVTTILASRVLTAISAAAMLGESGTDAFTIMRLMGQSTAIVSEKSVLPSTDAMKSAIERRVSPQKSRHWLKSRSRKKAVN